MKKSDLKQRMREVKYTTEHTLTPEQREKLIQEKFERARLMLETRERVKNPTSA
jgi:Spy/CpxP family protein refolding chaperone